MSGLPLATTAPASTSSTRMFTRYVATAAWEGISNEASSLAGHFQFDNLCWTYDNNQVTIESHTNIAFRDDVASRFLSYGWNVQRVGDANDLDMLERAFRTLKRTSDRPSLIIVDSHIGYGSPHRQAPAIFRLAAAMIAISTLESASTLWRQF
jgi:transketolase